MKPYYYVNRAGGSPSHFRYHTLESANNKALAMAAQFPGESYEIMQCLGITRAANPQTFWMDGVIPPHECHMNQMTDGTCGVCGKKLD